VTEVVPVREARSGIVGHGIDVRYRWMGCGGRRSTKGLLAEFRHHTGARKHAVLATVLALVGTGRYDDRFADAARRYAATPHGPRSPCAPQSSCTPPSVTSADRRTGGSSSRRSEPTARVRCGRATCSRTLHAVCAFDPHAPLLRDGTAALTRTMNPDGGVPFLAEKDVWISALAGRALS
jgi:hypothetical protein